MFSLGQWPEKILLICYEQIFSDAIDREWAETRKNEGFMGFARRRRRKNQFFLGYLEKN